jgi:thioredoxin 1
MAIIAITNDNFEEEVLKSEVPVLLDFWAAWCGPCKMMSSVVDEIAKQLEGKIKVGKINVDEEAALALKYQIMSIPTLIVMKNGALDGKSIGFMDKDEVVTLLNL